jgi:hypothetical protein
MNFIVLSVSNTIAIHFYSFHASNCFNKIIFSMSPVTLVFPAFAQNFSLSTSFARIFSASMFQHQLRVQFLLFHYQSYLNSSDNQKE